MKTVNPYLMFNGNCEEAFNFYKSVFGGEFAHLGRYSDIPDSENMEPMTKAEANRVMHVSFPISKETILMGSDSHPKFDDVTSGSNMSIAIGVESKKEADQLFNGLSNGGKVTMPLQDTFWGDYFGMFTDKFGFDWMVSFDKGEK